MKHYNTSEIYNLVGLTFPTPAMLNSIRLNSTEKACREAIESYKISGEKSLKEENDKLQSLIHDINRKIYDVKNECQQSNETLNRDIENYRRKLQHYEVEIIDATTELKKAKRSLIYFYIWRVFQWIIVIVLAVAAIYIAILLLCVWIVATFISSRSDK